MHVPSSPDTHTTSPPWYCRASQVLSEARMLPTLFAYSSCPILLLGDRGYCRLSRATVVHAFVCAPLHPGCSIWALGRLLGPLVHEGGKLNLITLGCFNIFQYYRNEPLAFDMIKCRTLLDMMHW